MLHPIVPLLEIAVLIIVLVVLVVFAAYQTSRTRMGYIPLRAGAVTAVVEAFGIPRAAQTTLFDLGCGDGRILEAALQTHPNIGTAGVEFHPMILWLARWRLRRWSSRVRMVRGDLLQTDLREATYIFTYLNSPTMALLEPKLNKELPRGARLVSCDFPLPTRKPTRTVKIGEPWQLAQTLYIYDY
jgi:hypothetical protein